jgi:inosine/xanthosine triphosphatase
MKVIVASVNPVKRNAVEEAFQKVFPEESFEFELQPFPSEVSAQPMSDEETITGAINRVNNAHKAIPGADYYVGIEGGLQKRDGELETIAWVVIKSKEGIYGKGSSSSLMLPRIVSEKILNDGLELGDACDIVFNEKNSKQGQGAVGILTHGLIDRTQYYVEPAIMALIPFKNKELYQK